MRAGVGFLAGRLERSSEPKAHEARLLILHSARSLKHLIVRKLDMKNGV